MIQVEANLSSLVAIYLELSMNFIGIFLHIFLPSFLVTLANLTLYMYFSFLYVITRLNAQFSFGLSLSYATHLLALRFFKVSI